jgi:hypothetical protein
MMRDHVAEEILGTMPDEESGRTVVRARLDCGCILEKMVANQDIVAGPDGRRTLRGKWPCDIHRGGGRR